MQRPPRRGPSFGSWFFGYNKAQVDLHIERLSQELAQRESSVQDRLASLAAESRELSDKINLLSSRLTHYVIRDKALDLAEKDAQALGQSMLISGHQRASEMLHSVEAEIRIHKQQMDSIDAEARMLKAQYGEMVDSVSKAMLERTAEPAQAKESASDNQDKVVMRILPESQKASAFIEEIPGGLSRLDLDIAGRRVISQSSIVIGEVSRLIINKKGGNVEGYEVAQSVQQSIPNGTVIPARGILAVKKDSLIVSNEYLMKAGFLPLSQAPHTVDKPVQVPEAAQPAAVPAATTPPQEATSAAAVTGDQLSAALQQLLHNLPLPSKADASDPTEAAKLSEAIEKMLAQIYAGAQHSQPVRVEPAVAEQAPATETVTPAILPSAIVPSAIVPSAPPLEPLMPAGAGMASQPSPAVAADAKPSGESAVREEQVEGSAPKAVTPEVPKAESPKPADSVRNIESRIARNQMSYVVGNNAGRDLISSEGTIIVAKGQEITQEVVERAKADGKVAELIVYMVIPGMDRDEALPS